MGAEFAESTQPSDALGLIRTEVGRETVGWSRLLEELVLPGLKVVVEFQGADRGVIEQR